MRRLTTTVLGAALALAAAPLAAQKEAPPAPEAPRAFRLPPTRSLTLPNGLKVTMVPFGTVPKTTVRLVLQTGNVDETPATTWLADVTADLLTEGGSASRNGQQLAEAVAGMGGSLGIGVGADETSIGADVLSEHGPALVAVIADLVQRPAFPAAELPRVIANRVRSLSIAKSRPGTLASERFSQTLYGDHPYGRLYPTEAQLQGYTVDQVRLFWTANTGGQRAHVYVSGVFDAAAMERAIRAAFGGWTRGTAAERHPVRPVARRALDVVDRPGAVQSTIYLGLPVPGPASPDAVTMIVTNSLLGGSFGSRITSNIREDKGYTYSPFSTLAQNREAAHWVEIADVTTNVTGASLSEIQKEIRRLQDEPPPEAELRGIQNNLAGTFVLQNSSRAGLVGQLQFVNLHGLGEQWLRTYTQRVMGVTPKDVQRAMKTYLSPDRMTLVVVGDKAQVDPQLAPFREGTP